MRVIFYIFLSVVGISLSVVILMPSLFDLNNYKDKIEGLVYSKTKNTLKIKGNIRLSFFPIIKLNVNDISYKDKNGDELIQSKELVIAPQFLPLIKGELIFNSIELVKPVIFIDYKKSKKSNWELAFNKKTNFKNKEENNITEKKQEVSTEKLNPFNIKALSIQSATVLLNYNNKKNSLKNVNLNLLYKKQNKYLINGYFDFNNQKFNLLYNINYTNKNLGFNGYLKNKNINIENESSINLENFNGVSKLDISLKNINYLVEQNLIKNIPLKIQSNLNFTSNSVIFNELRLVNDNNTLIIKGSLNKNNEKKILNIKLNSPKFDFGKILYSNIDSSFVTIEENLNDKNTETPKKNNFNIEDIIDKIFLKLKDYEIYTEASINQIIYKEYSLNNFNLNFSKNNAIDMNIKFKNNLFKEFFTKTNIKKNKNITLVMLVNNLNIEKLYKSKENYFLNGSLDFDLKAKTILKNKDIFLKKLNGDLKVKTKNARIIKVNLPLLKSNILNIRDLKDLVNLRNGVFTGDTEINDQELFIKIKNGKLLLPKNPILIKDNKIFLLGDYELYSKKLSADIVFDDKKNKLLSLFKLKLNGNINNVKTTVDYDKNNAEKIISKIAEKKMKKIIKDKLDSKFDSIIEDLLD